MLSLEKCLGANRPITFVVAESELEVLRYIHENYKKSEWGVYSTSITNLVPLNTLIKDSFKYKGKSNTTIQILDQILQKSYEVDNTRFDKYIFLDSQMYLKDAQVIRKIKDILARYQMDDDFTMNLIFVSQTVCVPMQLERLSEVVFFDLPDENQLRQMSDHLVDKLELGKKLKPSEEVINNLKGLTLYEVEQAYLQSFHIFKKIELSFIRDFKKNAIAKTDLLSLMETEYSFNDIGGMDNLKDWIKKSYGGWTVEGKKFGLPLLKGLLLVGLPGTGKSLIMKAIGSEWGLPVVSFDPSQIFSSRVGDSETNMRRVLKIVEDMSPCLMGDARITLADGQVTSIKEMYDNQYRGKVLSVNNDFEITESDVVLITKKKSDDLYNLKTSIGNIRATGNHKFPILESNGELHWKEAGDLKKGEFILCPRQVNGDKEFNILNYIDDDTRLYSKKLCAEFLERVKKEDYSYYLKHNRRVKVNGYLKMQEISSLNFNTHDLSHVEKIARGKGGYRDSSITKISTNIPEQELFYTLGLLWSDGNIGDKGYWYYDDALKKSQKTNKYTQRNQNSSKFYGDDLTLHNKIKDFFYKYFGVQLLISKSDFCDCYITTSPPVILCEIFRRIQKDLLSFSEDCQWAWLSGVLDGNGHIHKQRVSYTATKHLNNEYLRDVFLRVGIPTSSQKDNFKNKTIEITSHKFIEKLHRNIKLCHPKKIEHFDILEKSVKELKCRFDSLDIRELLKNLLITKDLITSVDPVTVKDRIRKQSFISDKISVSGRKVIHNYIEENRNIDVDKIRSVFKEIGSDTHWFFKKDFFFTPILEKNRIQGNFDVYDLCLNKNHNFIANRMFTHNCILSIDEIEKGFAGMQSSTFSDSGVTARVIGSFLIWMQECTKPVFIIATANNIQYLPPELINRFDETFFVNLPGYLERQDIFKIHINRLDRDPGQFDINALAEQSKDLSGREIEQTLRESMYNAFQSKEKKLTTEIIRDVLIKKTNLLTTMAEQLKYLLEWVGWDEDKRDGIRARYANVTESLDMGKIKSEIDDIIQQVEKPEE